ncbi:MAG: hypothetical protein DRJ97_03730 [Thermoprotei archaeon]|nr:MAG: hypothetical protein DRJ97_03730 [Thermoprotei archaeon]
MTVGDLALIALIALVAYVKIRKFRRRRDMDRCAMCGRLIAERPVELSVDGVKYLFCCEHCASAFLSSREEAGVRR